MDKYANHLSVNKTLYFNTKSKCKKADLFVQKVHKTKYFLTFIKSLTKNN